MKAFPLPFTNLDKPIVGMSIGQYMAVQAYMQVFLTESSSMERIRKGIGIDPSNADDGVKRLRAIEQCFSYPPEEYEQFIEVS